jgi:hypothetical protein
MPKTQRVRSKTSYKTVTLTGLLTKRGKGSYLRIETPDGETDYLEGQSLYRLAKAIVTRFEANQR